MVKVAQNFDLGWRRGARLLALVLSGFALIYGSYIQIASAAAVSDIRKTKHNLSKNAPSTNTVKADSEDQICVFCHTPHAATGNVSPLWNRSVSTSGYTRYTSASLDADSITSGYSSQPAGSSLLCLSCHDGQVALGNVNVLNGQANATISVSGSTTTKMPTGTDGYTRNLGTDLSNDHPISVTYNNALANKDGELQHMSTSAPVQRDTLTSGTLIGIRTSGYKPTLPLAGTGASGAGQVQCGTCHDPHLYDSADDNRKFLRLNRLQATNTTSDGAFDSSNDIICLACHTKNNNDGNDVIDTNVTDSNSWAYSVHAHPDVADETYTSTAVSTRQFPSGLPVYRAACLNCHDTHTVTGARRLLRGGVSGGNPALEETCYQCHITSASSVLNSSTNVPNIKSDFTGTNKRMPIDKATEVHTIGSTASETGGADCSGSTNKCGSDFVEERTKLGLSNLSNRHVECTDCHNPHRIIRAKIGLPGTLTSANTKDTVSGRNTGWATHQHTDDNNTSHTNIISGALRGAWGVEPVYNTSASFHLLPDSYTVKRGDPGNSSSTSVGSSYVTREYQICLKCHSDYGYSDNNKFDGTEDRPTVASCSTCTSSGTNGLTVYTNQAKEFQAPSAHADEGSTVDLGTEAGSSDTNFDGQNHRSWHPVMGATGRTTTKRGMGSANGWLEPWNNAVGTQTMYCTDCHGSDTGSTTVIPGVSAPWGPHGSANNFLLKGVWSSGMGATGRDSGRTANFLCFKCHDETTYTTRNDDGTTSGFYGGGKGNLHNYHVDKLNGLYCVWCHVAVPHGWKNKSLLVNLNDVGEEAGQGSGTSKEVSINGNEDYYSKAPYYLYAKLKVATFAVSGSWSAGACGSASKSGTGATTGRINSTNGETNNDTQTGKSWMISTCNPPSN